MRQRVPVTLVAPLLLLAACSTTPELQVTGDRMDLPLHR